MGVMGERLPLRCLLSVAICFNLCFFLAQNIIFIIFLSNFVVPRNLNYWPFDLTKFQAESSEDLYGWKTALEQALAQAPSAALVMGHNGIFRNDTSDTMEGSICQCLCLSLYLGSRAFFLYWYSLDFAHAFREG